VNDQTRKVRVVDKAAQAGKVHTRKADMTNSQHVPSPLPGAIEVMYVGVGSEVKKGEPLMLVTAMKMAVSLKSIGRVLCAILIRFIIGPSRCSSRRSCY
jgi:pyruvate carboxylase